MAAVPNPDSPRRQESQEPQKEAGKVQMTEEPAAEGPTAEGQPASRPAPSVTSLVSLDGYWAAKTKQLGKLTAKEAQNPLVAPTWGRRKILPRDKEASKLLVATEVPLMLSQLAELASGDLSVRGYSFTQARGKSTLMLKDLGLAIYTAPEYDFLRPFVSPETLEPPLGFPSRATPEEQAMLNAAIRSQIDARRLHQLRGTTGSFSPAQIATFYALALQPPDTADASQTQTASDAQAPEVIQATPAAEPDMPKNNSPPSAPTATSTVSSRDHKDTAG